MSIVLCNVCTRWAIGFRPQRGIKTKLGNGRTYVIVGSLPQEYSIHRGGCRISVRGFYLYKRAKFLKPRPYFGRIRPSQQIQSCKSQLYAKVSENTSLLASIFVREGVLQVKSQCQSRPDKDIECVVLGARGVHLNPTNHPWICPYMIHVYLCIKNMLWENMTFTIVS